MPAAAEAVERLREAPDLGVGVHLNASQGPPLTGDPLLAGPGAADKREALLDKDAALAFKRLPAGKYQLSLQGVGTIAGDIRISALGALRTVHTSGKGHSWP